MHDPKARSAALAAFLPVALALALSWPAAAQPDDEVEEEAPIPPPVAPQGQPRPAPPERGGTPDTGLRGHPVLRLQDPEDWTSTIQVQLLADVNQNVRRDVLTIDAWAVNSMSVVLPAITTTSNAVSDPRSVRGELFLDGVKVDDSATIIGPYQGQAMYARYEATKVELNGFRVRQSATVTCYETVYDEKLAATLPWPERWPPEADSTFQPQQLISETRSSFENEGPVNDLVRSWTNGQDPKSLPPAELAKYLTAKVWDHVRVDRPSISNRPSDEGIILQVEGDTDFRDMQVGRGAAIAMEVGFNVQHADETARTGRGSEHDACLLLTGVYRAAGLPARVVIGYRERTEKRPRLSPLDRYHAWVEFALLDPEANDGKGQLIWVPVDLIELMGSSSRARPVAQAWKYFGTNDDMDTNVPLATHYHPPTTVRSYAVPALYGWTTDPPPPDTASQGLYVNLSGVPVRGGVQEAPQRQPQRRRGR